MHKSQLKSHIMTFDPNREKKWQKKQFPSIPIVITWLYILKMLEKEFSKIKDGPSRILIHWCFFFSFFAKVRFEQMHWSDVMTLDGYTLYLKKTKVYSRHLRCKTLQVPGRTSQTKLLFQISLKVRLSSRHKHQLW